MVKRARGKDAHKGSQKSHGSLRRGRLEGSAIYLTGCLIGQIKTFLSNTAAQKVEEPNAVFDYFYIYMM
jgi:hypothetical protein